MATQDPSRLWSRANPLTFYGNPEKLDDLLVRAYGELVAQEQSARKTSGKAAAKVKYGLGSLMRALLPSAEAELGTELSFESAKTKIVNATFESKLRALMEFVQENEAFFYLDTLRGLLLNRTEGQPVSEWSGSPIESRDMIDRIGHILGIFHATRVMPPNSGNAQLGDDYFHQRESLWLLSTSEESSVQARIPMIVRNMRPVSQHGTLALIHGQASFLNIEAFGLLSWNEGQVTCDPVAWRLFY